MTNTNTNTNNECGEQHRQRRMMALLKVLGCPKNAPVPSGLACAAVDEPNDVILCGIVQRAIANRRDTLVHCYRNVGATDPFLTVLVLCTTNGAELLPVEIIEHRKPEPLQLITKDSTRCFRLDDRLLLHETRVPSKVRLPRAFAAAKARYDVALADTLRDHAGWHPPVVTVEGGPASTAA